MQVLSDPQAPNSIRIAYDRPKPGLSSLGIERGTVLFSGARSGDTVTGKAVTFSRHCDPLEYEVSGRIVGASRVVLEGRKPSRNRDCKVVGSVEETLEFELISR